MQRTFKISNEMKIGIYSSLIASILLMAGLERVISTIGRFLLRITSGIFITYQDRLYAEVATGTPDYAYMIVLFIGSLFIGPFLAAVVFKLIEVFKKFKGEETSTPGIPAGTEIAIEENTSTSDDAPPVAVAPNPTIKHSYLRAALKFIILIFLPITFSFMLADGYIKLYTLTTFRQHVTILTPYIENKERDFLLSKFASMRSRRDYDSVRADIERLANAAKIELPPNKLYPLP